MQNGSEWILYLLIYLYGTHTWQKAIFTSRTGALQLYKKRLFINTWNTAIQQEGKDQNRINGRNFPSLNWYWGGKLFALFRNAHFISKSLHFSRCFFFLVQILICAKRERAVMINNTFFFFSHLPSWFCLKAPALWI